jgi:hypothetical protein
MYHTYIILSKQTLSVRFGSVESSCAGRVSQAVALLCSSPRRRGGQHALVSMICTIIPRYQRKPEMTQVQNLHLTKHIHRVLSYLLLFRRSTPYEAGSSRLWPRYCHSLVPTATNVIFFLFPNLCNRPVVRAHHTPPIGNCHKFLVSRTISSIHYLFRLQILLDRRAQWLVRSTRWTRLST